MKRFRICFFILALPTTALAQLDGPNTPDSLSFQGFLADTSGALLDTTLNITFKLYKGPTQIWTQTVNDVAVEEGGFNVILGGPGASLEFVAFNSPLDLGITIGGSELTPRTPLTSSAYALAIRGFYAVHAEDASNNRAPNLIGGAANNYMGPDVVGATISGGGGWIFSGAVPDSVLDDWGTIGGGYRNTASGIISTIAGGAGNRATGVGSTVGGGGSNSAGGDKSTIGGGGSNSTGDIYTTVGGGRFNSAGSSYSTVAGGSSNKAGGSYSTVAGGSSNMANGPYSAVPGGRDNAARGDYSFAAGDNARSNHDGSFVWSDRSLPALADSFETTGTNQFLIQAAGGVGIGTNAPSNQVSISGSADISDSLAIGTSSPINDLTVVGNADFTGRVGIGTNSPTEALHINEAVSSGIFLGGNGSHGPHGIVFDDNTPGNGVQLFWRTGPNRLVIEDTSGGTIGDPDDAFYYSPSASEFAFRGDVIPMTTNTYSLGRSGLVWTSVWATTGIVNMSDRRLKKAIEPISSGLDEILLLRPVSFAWRESPDSGRRLGLVAQEVEPIVPEVVRPPESEDEYYGLNYGELVPVMIKAIQDQQDIITELLDSHSELSERLASVERSITN